MVDVRALNDARWLTKLVQGNQALDGQALEPDQLSTLTWWFYYGTVQNRRKRRRRFNNKKGV
jgi:hypothetical protein